MAKFNNKLEAALLADRVRIIRKTIVDEVWQNDVVIKGVPEFDLTHEILTKLQELEETLQRRAK